MVIKEFVGYYRKDWIRNFTSPIIGAYENVLKNLLCPIIRKISSLDFSALLLSRGEIVI